eukprot:1157315-Pelagomonas_calceolata.AAC.12
MLLRQILLGALGKCADGRHTWDRDTWDGRHTWDTWGQVYLGRHGRHTRDKHTWDGRHTWDTWGQVCLCTGPMLEFKWVHNWPGWIEANGSLGGQNVFFWPWFKTHTRVAANK